MRHSKLVLATLSLPFLLGLLCGHNLPAAETLPAKPATTWRQVVSGDYTNYIANLKGVGVPSLTIRDIIVGDINRSFTAQAEALKRAQVPTNQWVIVERAAWNPAEHRPLQEALTQLDQKRLALIRDLLGANTDPGSIGLDPRTFQATPPRPITSLEFLPHEKEAAVRRLNGEMAKKYRDTLALPKHTSDSLAILKQAYQELEEGLTQVLTPEEKLIHDLAFSQTGAFLQNQLVGFHPTQEEIRAILNVSKIHDEVASYRLQSQLPPDAEADRQVAEALEKGLGRERFLAFGKSCHPAFQADYKFAIDHGLDPALADSLFALRTPLEGGAKTRDSQVTLRTELQKRLGPQQFNAYLNSPAGRWAQ